MTMPAEKSRKFSVFSRLGYSVKSAKRDDSRAARLSNSSAITKSRNGREEADKRKRHRSTSPRSTTKRRSTENPAARPHRQAHRKHISRSGRRHSTDSKRSDQCGSSHNTSRQTSATQVRKDSVFMRSDSSLDDSLAKSRTPEESDDNSAEDECGEFGMISPTMDLEFYSSPSGGEEDMVKLSKYDNDGAPVYSCQDIAAPSSSRLLTRVAGRMYSDQISEANVKIVKHAKDNLTDNVDDDEVDDDDEEGLIRESEVDHVEFSRATDELVRNMEGGSEYGSAAAAQDETLLDEVSDSDDQCDDTLASSDPHLIDWLSLVELAEDEATNVEINNHSGMIHQNGIHVNHQCDV